MPQSSQESALGAPPGGAWVRGRGKKTLPPAPAPVRGRLARLLGEAGWILAAVAALALLFVLASYSKADPAFSHATGATRFENLGGRAGAWVADVLLLLFGLSAWWWVAAALVLVAAGWRRLHERVGGAAERLPGWARGLGFGLLLGASSGLEALRLHSLKIALP
ncbi:MAG: hypothetical protein RL669_1890, partial [Pseudomonadota bacterium]